MPLGKRGQRRGRPWRSIHDERFEGALGEEEAFQGVELAADLVAQGGAFAGEVGGEGPVHAAFVGGVVAAATFVIEVDAALAGFEVIRGMDGAVVKQIKGESVGDGGAEGLDEVEGEGGAAGLGFVEVAEGGIEAGGVEGGGGLVGEEGVAKGEECVGGVVGWAARPAFERGVGGEEGGEGVEVGSGGGAFVAATRFDGGGGEGGDAMVFEAVDGGGSRLLTIAGEALEEAARVGDFGFDEMASHRE